MRLGLGKLGFFDYLKDIRRAVTGDNNASVTHDRILVVGVGAATNWPALRSAGHARFAAAGILRVYALR